jgi:high-affinity iron transporter
VYLKKISILLLFLLAICSKSFSIQPQDEGKVRMLINLLDYIAKDYGMAVENGVVLSEFEYAEMNEFVATASNNYDALLSSGAIQESAVPSESMKQLKLLIEQMATPEEVAQAADKIKKNILSLGLIPLTPAEWPNLKTGQSLFAENCASCHGALGAGDGAAGAALVPPPTNFTGKGIMQGIAPFQAFNTITLGIPGTGMRDFNELSETDKWDLAFYILTLQYPAGLDQPAGERIELDELAVLSDEELIQKHPELDIGSQRKASAPEKVEVKPPLAVARSFLTQVKSSYQKGDSEKATQLALLAYLQGVEPIEAQVKASDNSLFNRLESSMLNVRALIKSGASESDLNQGIADAMIVLDEAELVLQQGKRGIGMTAFIAASILLREGLEAFFVILAILGILKTVNAPAAIRWLHGGWISAVVVGVIGWFFADALLSLSAQSRELMEGLIALFAVVVLLYLGFWLHGKTEASRWKEFVEIRIKNLINKNNMIGLGAFSFMVVFREAFESVLFLSSLSTNTGNGSRLGILIGAIGSAIILGIMAWAILKWFKKMPIRKVFLYSSIVILALAFVLAGQGIHAIQEGGYMDIRSFPLNLKAPFLGIYPTYETLSTQILVLAGIGVLWFFNGRKATATVIK